MIKTILFDSDGVLAHTEELFLEINHKYISELGIQHAREDFENYTFITNLGTSGFLRGVGCSEQQINSFKEKRDKAWQERVYQTNVVDASADNVFQKLKEDYRLCIVTNTNRINFSKIYHDSNIPNLADFIILREDYINGKPEPDSYLEALRVSNTIAREAIVIEDSPRGITAGKRAGMLVVGIVNPLIANLDISHADYVIKNLEELPEVLSRIV